MAEQEQPLFDVVIPPGHEQTYASWHFAPAVRTGNTIYVSGVIGVGGDGKVPDDPSEEFTNAFAQLTATLAAAGATPDNVVEMTTFHVGMAETLRAFTAAKDVVITEPYPAWTAIGCTEMAIPGARAEVKVTAVVAD